MRLIANASMRTKLILLTVAAVTLGLVLAGIGLALNDMALIRTAKVAQLHGQAQMLAFNSTGVLVFQQSEPAAKLLASLRLQPTVENACLYDVNGNVLASYAKDPEKDFSPPRRHKNSCQVTKTGYIEIFLPVIDRTDGVEHVGTLFLRANQDDLHGHFWDRALIVASVMFFSLVAAVSLAAMLQRGISGPVLKLAETAENISSAGDYSIRIERESSDELGKLYRAFNRMLDQVETSNRELQLAQTDLLQVEVYEQSAVESHESEFLSSSLPADNPVFQRIIDKFVRRLEEELVAMHRADEAGNFDQLARLAHWLKGTGGTAGFSAFTEPAKRLETAAKDQDHREIGRALAELVDLSNRVALGRHLAAAKGSEAVLNS